MKRAVIFSFVILAGSAAVPAAAFELPDSVSQPSVYFHLGFGGRAEVANRLAYGLRFDPAWREDNEPMPPVLALDFTEAGFRQLVLGGVPLTTTTMRLSESEGGTTDAPGLRFWRWGLQQWGVVIGGGIIALVLADYEDPSKSDEVRAEAEPTVGCDDGNTVPVPPGTLGGGCI